MVDMKQFLEMLFSDSERRHFTYTPSQSHAFHLYVSIFSFDSRYTVDTISMWIQEQRCTSELAYVEQLGTLTLSRRLHMLSLT